MILLAALLALGARESRRRRAVFRPTGSLFFTPPGTWAVVWFTLPNGTQGRWMGEVGSFTANGGGTATWSLGTTA